MKKTGYYYLGITFLILSFVLGIAFMFCYRTIDFERLNSVLKNPSIYDSSEAFKPGWAAGIAAWGVFAFFSAICFAINTVMSKLDELNVKQPSSPIKEFVYQRKPDSTPSVPTSQASDEPRAFNGGTDEFRKDIKGAKSAVEALAILDRLNVQDKSALESFKQELTKLSGLERLYGVDQAAIKNLIEKYVP